MPASSAPEPLARVHRPRLYEQLVARLLEHIESAGLQPGDALPTERDLAATLGVSRATVAQALVALEVLGVVRVVHGSGATVQTRAPLDATLDRLREHTARLPEVVEARMTLELQTAASAALRRDDADLAALEDALELMRREIEDGERGLAGDQAFYEAVTAAAHNQVLARLMDYISDLVLESRIESLGQPGRPERSLEAHREIVAAIAAQDPERAREAMRTHLGMVSDVALLQPGG